MFIWRVFRRVLAKLIQLLLLNRVVTLGLLAVLVVGFVIMPLLASAGSLTGSVNQAAGLPSGKPIQAAPSSDGSGIATVASSQNLAPDPAVETYVKGMVTFDANLMWASLHPQFRSQLQSQGMTLDQRKAQIAEMRASGLVYQKVYYIGGFEGKSGLRYYFYVLIHPDANGKSEGDETTFMFTVAPDGAGIVNIE
jgi:hypothetical protein